MNISEINPAPYNPRTISQEALDGLKSSMDKFGDISGITWNRRTGNLISGHQRMSLLKKEFPKMKLVNPIDGNLEKVLIMNGKTYTGHMIRVVDWDEPLERAANIAANSPHISGEFNVDGLKEMLAQIKIEMPVEFGELRFDQFEFPEFKTPNPDIEDEEKEVKIKIIECPACRHKFAK